VAIEATAREQADTAEAEARETADTNEATAREQADTDEATAREQADTAEATAREQGDTDTLAAAKTYTDEKIVAVYKFKGTVPTYDDLPTEADVGDVWEAVDTGDNYVWDGTKWDSMGGIADLSSYRTAAAQDVIDNTKANDNDVVHKTTADFNVGTPTTDSVKFTTNQEFVLNAFCNKLASTINTLIDKVANLETQLAEATALVDQLNGEII
jgi:hypothetical protein